MHNDHPCNEPSEPIRPESGPCADEDLHPLSSAAADIEFWLQVAGTWRERNAPASVVLVLFGSAPALLTSRGPDGRSERTPVVGETAWFIPSGTPVSAHWHGPRAIACLGSASLEQVGHPTRIFRLDDLARRDWALNELLRGYRLERDSGHDAAMAIARRVDAVLQENDTHWRNVGLSTERLYATTDFIEEHLTHKLSRELLARADGQSLHHFARMFKLRTRLSLREYIALRRCFRARELIGSGMRLVDAAATVGFFDQPEMCRKFNHVFGCPPSTFAPAEPS